MDLSNETLVVIAAGASAFAATASAVAAGLSLRHSKHALKLDHSPYLNVYTTHDIEYTYRHKTVFEVVNTGTGLARLTNITWYVRGTKILGENLTTELWKMVKQEYGLTEEQIGISSAATNEAAIAPGKNIVFVALTCSKPEIIESILRRGTYIHLTYTSPVGEETHLYERMTPSPKIPSNH
ncbi:hypothetical protein [uncultured Pseudoteredinibacter sp.]|uniref:hypothetical protein n=1 Tax=uncultured Pseudoteredinibacter sp. TaxID=1641701 RepID=UPI00261836F4|nr:hypothetical protein [uncultured Pseudoteredinibacter sp.]